MKRSLMRPTAALFPMVLLVAALFGNDVQVEKLFLYYCVIQMISLCSVDSFRNAAAREPGIRRVDRRFSGAWIMTLLGIAECAVAEYLLGWDQNPLLMIVATGCIIIEQLFEERIYALSHPSDGAILSVVANVLLFAGLMIDSSKGMASPTNLSGFYTLCGAGMGMLISIIASYIIEPMHSFSLVPRNIGFFPKAAVQSLLYPAMMFGMYGLVRMESGTMVDGQDLIALLAGMMLWRISRTVCRRAEDESRLLNLLIIAVCATVMIASLWVKQLKICAEGVVVAMICTIIVFCARSWRIYVGAALMAGVWIISITGNTQPWMVVACSAAAVGLNLHKAFLRKI